MPVSVLLVEDNPGDALLTIESLSGSSAGVHFDVTRARSLEEARQRLLDRAFDAILLDLGLPDGNGLESVTSISGLAPGVPLLVLTGLHDEKLGLQAVMRGAQDYLIKRIGRHERLPRSILFALERKRSERHLSHLAEYDALTDVPNRRLLHDRLELGLARARRNREFLAVLFLDLDGFKDVNDTRGHAVGDLLLQEAARRLRRCVRETDTVARLGGDEFAVIVSEIVRVEDVAALARKILDALAQPFVLDGHTLGITASMGIGLYPGDGKDAGTLLNNADVAMYGAKRSGKGRYRFHSAAMHARASERIDLAAALRHALAHGGLVLHYLPVVGVESGRTVGLEALIRWLCPGRGLVGPAEIIPVAEEAGLIEPMEDWVLQEATRQFRRWRDLGHRHLHLGVNLSMRQLARDGLRNLVDSALRSSGVAPGDLEFDVNEGDLMRSGERGRRSLERLRGTGVRIAIDDFGTGSSLAQLRKFAVTALKIDRTLLKDVAKHTGDAVIHEALIAMAHGLGLEVGAEGVEREDQMTFLRDHHCDYAQGFYFSHPLPADAMGAHLEREWRRGRERSKS